MHPGRDGFGRGLAGFSDHLQGPELYRCQPGLLRQFAPSKFRGAKDLAQCNQAAVDTIHIRLLNEGGSRMTILHWKLKWFQAQKLS